MAFDKTCVLKILFLNFKVLWLLRVFFLLLLGLKKIKYYYYFIIIDVTQYKYSVMCDFAVLSSW